LAFGISFFDTSDIIVQLDVSFLCSYKLIETGFGGKTQTIFALNVIGLELDLLKNGFW
jgi:hypothetical protein